MPGKNQPFLFVNNENKECLFYCEAQEQKELKFGKSNYKYEITPWKVVLSIDGVNKPIDLPKLVTDFGEIIIECNPHILIKENNYVFLYVAGFMAYENAPIIYYLCSLDVDFNFTNFTNHKILKQTFSGTIIDDKIISIDDDEIQIDNKLFSSFGNISRIYRICPIYEEPNFILITAITKDNIDVSYIVQKDISSYCTLTNSNNKNIYKCTFIKNKLIYTLKIPDALNINVENRDLVEELFNFDFKLKLQPTNATHTLVENIKVTPPEKTVKHFLKGATKAVKAMTLPETEQSKARLAVCRGCDKWTGKSCKVCGCYVNLKVKIPEEKCPEGKW